MKLEFDPRLMDAAIFLEIRRREMRGDRDLLDTYHLRVDPLYEHDMQGRDRETAFRRVDDDFFRALGFTRKIREAIREYPILEAGLDTFVFLAATSRKEETADLFVRAGDCHGRRIYTAVLRMRAETLVQPQPFRILVRREFFHISDMLDPAFGYRASLGNEGDSPVRENLIRDRYHVLWKIYIDGRLTREGRFEESEPFGLPLLQAVFGALRQEQLARLLHLVRHADALSHDQLLRIADNPLALIETEAVS